MQGQLSNFFPRSSSIANLNGKGKLRGEEDAPPRECSNSDLGKGGKNSTAKQKMIS